MARLLVFFAFCLFTFSCKASDGDGILRRWAVNVGINTSKSVVSTDNTPARFGNSTGFGDSGATIHLEYYIPYTNLSIVGGYENETLSFCDGDVLADMNNIMLGGRWYVALKSWFVQPYIGANVYCNLSGRNDNGRIDVSGSHGSYSCEYTIKNPMFSAAPSIGTDLYLFSCIALTINYGYRFAVDGKASIASDFGKEHFDIRSSMNRHSVSAGLKVSFPFKFTGDDFEGIFNYIYNNVLFPNTYKSGSVKHPLIHNY